MTDKELRKLKRFQLLELLIMQIKENEDLRQQLNDAESREQERDLRLADLGSVAEASMELHGVFTAAQKAADDYLAAARRQAEDIVADAHRQAKEILRRAQNEVECTAILQEHFKP